MDANFDRFKRFSYDEFMAKHCYFRCSRPPDVDGIKIFNKDDQLTKHCSFILHFATGLSLSNILIPSTSGGLEHLKQMFCNEFIMTKTFKPIKIRRHWPPVLFYIFSARSVLVLGCSFFTPAVLLIKYNIIITDTVKWMF